MHNIKQTSYPKAVIISACIGSDLDSDRHSILGRDLLQAGYKFKSVQGVYKGKHESSYYIECSKLDDFVHLHDLAKQYKQESILILDSQRNATLIYIDNGTSESIGKFTQVAKHDAVEHDNYTYDFINDGYYICK